MSAAIDYRLNIEINRAIVQEARQLLRDLMLERIVAMSADPVFLALVDDLVADTGCTRQWAAMQLYDLSAAIYRAAEDVHA
jgi:methyl coenzyme M reductase alpha subunit